MVNESKENVSDGGAETAGAEGGGSAFSSVLGGEIRRAPVGGTEAMGWTARFADTGSFAVTGSLAMGHVLIVGPVSEANGEMVRVLQDEGFEVVGVAQTTPAAMRLIRTHPVALVLILLRTGSPEDGIEIGRALLRERSVPLVLLAEDTAPAAVRRALELAPDGYLSVPVDERTLVTTCVAALRRQRTSQLARWMNEALDSSAEAMVVLDRLADQAAQRVSNVAFRRRFSGVEAQTCAQLVHAIVGPNEERRRDTLVRAIARGTELRLHVGCVASDGEAFPATIWVRPIRDRESFCHYVLLVVEDLTRDLGYEDSRRLRASLRPLVSELDTLLEQVATATETGGRVPTGVVESVSRVQRRLQLLHETLSVPVDPENRTEVLSYLNERVEAFADWLGAPIEVALPRTVEGMMVAVGAGNLDRIFFDIASGLREGGPFSVKISRTFDAAGAFALRIDRHGPVTHPQAFKSCLRKETFGRARLDASPLIAARRGAELVGGSLQLIEASDHVISLLVELPVATPALTGPPRRTTAEILLNPNVRASCVVATSDPEQRRRVGATLREALLGVAQVSGVQALARMLDERSEALDLLIVDSEILRALQAEEFAHTSLHLACARVLVLGRMGDVPMEALSYRFLPWPFTDEQCVNAVLELLDESSYHVSNDASAVSAAPEGFAADTARDSTEPELVERARILFPQLLEEFVDALGTLQVHYQPLVRSSDGSIFAYEALMRPAHPVLSHPGLMLDAAERLGLIAMLGRVIRERIARDCAGLRDPKDQIFVNLHPKEFTAALCAPDDPLRPYARRIVYEITERAHLSTIPELETTLSTLRARGFRFAVDDLGEGYAGLVSLQRLRPEVVKLDMSLVRGIHRSPFKRDLLKTLQVFFRAQRYETVAEGVETREEADALTGLGITLLQGYLFAKPGPPWPEL